MSRAFALLAVCALGTVQAYVHRVGLAPLLPALMEDTGLGYAAAGMLVSAYFWTYTAVQIPVGVMTDRAGPRRTMLTALPVLAAAVVAFSVSRGLTEGVLARCVVGIGAAGFWLPALRLIQEWFPPRARGRATGICMAGAGIGGTAALALMPALAASLGWRWSYATTLVPLVVMLPLTLAWVRPGPYAAELAAVPVSPSPLGDVAALLRRPVVWWLGLMCLCSYGALLGIVTWLPTFLVETQGRDRSMAGLVTALLTLGITASWPAAGFLSDRFGRRKPVGLLGQTLAAGACLGLASLGPATSLPITGALVLATGLVMGGMVTPFLLIPDLVPPRLLGAASGVINTFWLLGGLAAPALVGAVLDATGSFAVVFAAAGALELLALACLTMVPEARRRQAEAPPVGGGVGVAPLRGPVQGHRVSCDTGVPMNPAERGAASLDELKAFLAFLRNLWGVLAGVSVFFPLSNVLVNVIPLGRYGEEGGVFEHLSPPLVTSVATLVTVFLVLWTFANRERFGEDRTWPATQRRAWLSLVAGMLALVAYLVIHTFYAQYAWSAWGWGSGDPRKLLAEVPLLATYCGWFAFVTRAFLLLAMREFFRRAPSG